MDSIYLQGSEAVTRASNSMSSSADDMIRASNNISNALSDHQRFLTEWLDRFENILKENKND